MKAPFPTFQLSPCFKSFIVVTDFRWARQILTWQGNRTINSTIEEEEQEIGNEEQDYFKSNQL